MLIEWCENVDEYLDEGGVYVTIGRVPDDENKRTVTIRYEACVSL